MVSHQENFKYFSDALAGENVDRPQGEYALWLALLMSDLKGQRLAKKLRQIRETFPYLFCTEEDEDMAVIRIKHRNLKSTNIHSAGYDSDKALLEVRFRSGGTYRYYDVPQDVYDGLMESMSPGRYFHQNIRTSFKFKKVAQKAKDA